MKLIEDRLAGFVRGNTNYFQSWKKDMSRFCSAVERYSTSLRGFDNCRPITKTILDCIFHLGRMLYEGEANTPLNIELPYRWMIHPPVYKDEEAQRTHRFTSSCIM